MQAYGQTIQIQKCNEKDIVLLCNEQEDHFSEA